MTATTERPTPPRVEALHWNGHTGEATHRDGPHVRLTLLYTPGEPGVALDLEVEDHRIRMDGGRQPCLSLAEENETNGDIRLRLEGMTPAALETLEAAVAALMVRLRAAGIVPPVAA